ncbi:MAG: branched-chain amino acid ABC transporter permease, partial [Chroococcidiopsidaceae cyanobacterium CP_BM_ER_R8_30]|nr:branched-chain amino acid ABC transporter permease [Chroococcidiopsidaceae cyanobacterium CP_BM_ER_R8_30]
MAKATKSGNILGTVAALTVLLFGGWSGAFIGWLLGAGAGLMAAQGKRTVAPKLGIRLGISAGLTLGIWIFVASLVQGFLLLPATGESAQGFQALLYGGVGLTVAMFTGWLTGWLQGLGKNRQRANLALLALILISFPFIDQFVQTNWIATVIQILIFALLALGLNIVVGYAGLLDLGYAAFFAIGAYTTGFLSSPQLNVEWNFWIVIWIAAAVAAVAGVILGSPTLPLRGDYLAIVTLGFGEIVPVVFRNLTNVQLYEPISSIFASIVGRPELAICLLGCPNGINLTGGEAGINPIGRPALPLIGTFETGQYLPWYYLVLFLVVFSTFMVSRLRDSRLGRAWTAIREDELAASAMGINLVQTKLLAFAMGATFSGFAGAFYGSYISAIFPGVFDFSVSVIILCMVILGGLGNIAGVLLGCTIIMAADRLYLPQLAQVLKSLLNTSVLPNIENPALRDFLATSVDPIQ